MFIKYFSDTLRLNGLFSSDIILINEQDNGIECGVLSLYNLELILDGRIGKKEQISKIKTYRETIYKRIMELSK